MFNQIKEFYFGNHIIDKTQIVAYEKLFSDVMFIYSIQRTMRLQAVNSDASVRFVLWVYSSKFNSIIHINQNFSLNNVNLILFIRFNAFAPLNIIYDNPSVNGLATPDKTGHADDLGYTF